MPERAHALITLKKLIASKNSNIQTNKTQLITVLKVINDYLLMITYYFTSSFFFVK